MCVWIFSRAPCHTSPATVDSIIVVIPSPTRHRVATGYPQNYPQKNRGVTGIELVRYAPKTGYRVEVSSLGYFRVNGFRLKRGEVRLARIGSARRFRVALPAFATGAM